MTVFATEFPVVSTTNKAEFIAQMIRWLRHSKYSRVLDDVSESDISGDFAYFGSSNGENLTVRAIDAGEFSGSVGFRHDLPDEDGRVWRTEAVLRNQVNRKHYAILRLRTQCIAIVAGTKLETPKKPYLIKSYLRDNIGGMDGDIKVSDAPLWLERNSASLNKAQDILLGEDTTFLPTIYITATGDFRHIISKRHIEKFAYDLGGVAHVVVEPDKSFLAELRNRILLQRINSGSVALCVPKHGIVRVFDLNWEGYTKSKFFSEIEDLVIQIRSQLPSSGFDWTELQEKALLVHREKEKQRLTASQIEDLYLDEIKNLQDRIKQLESDLSSRSVIGIISNSGDYIYPPYVLNEIGQQIYPGEFGDRLKYAASVALTQIDRLGIDSRTVEILKSIVNKVALSPGLNTLLDEIKRSTRESSSGSSITAVLKQYGYRAKSTNKHIRMEPLPDLRGLEAITIAKTPSDHRGAANMRSQIEATLGLTHLKTM